MNITEIRIKLMDRTEDRLRAFCSITFDDSFVIRDLKIIEGNNGPFVAMPSRKLTSNCPECRCKNHLRSRFCNNCGRRLPNDQVAYDSQGRAKLYADVAHPINAISREKIQAVVVSEFELELERAKLPGYVSRYDDSYDDSESTPSRVPSKSTGEKVERSDLSKTEIAGPHSPSKHATVSEKVVSDSVSENRPSNRSMDMGSTPEPGSRQEEEPKNSGEFQANSGTQNYDVSPDSKPKPNRQDFGKGIFD